MDCQLLIIDVKRVHGYHKRSSDGAATTCTTRTPGLQTKLMSLSKTAFSDRIDGAF